MSATHNIKATIARAKEIEAELGSDTLAVIFSYLSREVLDELYSEFPAVMQNVAVHSACHVDDGSRAFDRYPNMKVLTLNADENTDYRIFRKAEVLHVNCNGCESLDSLYGILNLRALHLHTYGGPTEALRHLASLEILEMTRSTLVTGETLSHLKNLRELAFADMALCDTAFGNLDQITKFSCTNCNLAEQPLSKLKNLENLSLIGVDNITNHSLLSINMTVLFINGCPLLSGGCFRHMTNLKSLTFLDCGRVRDRDFKHLSQLESANLMDCRNVTDRFFISTPLIRKLKLTECNAVEGNFPQYIPKLEELEIQNCENSRLRKCPSLISLTVENVRLHVDMIAGSPLIESMTIIGNCDVPVNISELHRLRILQIQENVFDGGLLRNLTSLRELELTTCDNVVDDDLGFLVNLEHLKVARSFHFYGLCLLQMKKLASLEIFMCENFHEGNLLCFTDLDNLVITLSNMTGIGLSNFKRIGNLCLLYCKNVETGYLERINFGSAYFGHDDENSTPVDASRLRIKH